MRIPSKTLTAMTLALSVATGALADGAPAPAPAQAYPAGYVNPFDPNWWLATLNGLLQLYTVPAGTTAAAPATAAPAAAAPASAATPAYPAGYVNPFDPNWWLAGLATMASSPAVPAVAASGGAVAGSPYVTMQTAYGPVHMFNYADPNAWAKLFAQPFAVPGQSAAK
ncbi:MAG: hypothetical protein PHS77_02425 [Gallionellaceae bacterium]|nr:hypothetical protein [Gallionellaceae bacterium]